MGKGIAPLAVVLLLLLAVMVLPLSLQQRFLLTRELLLALRPQHPRRLRFHTLQTLLLLLCVGDL